MGFGIRLTCATVPSVSEELRQIQAFSFWVCWGGAFAKSMLSSTQGNICDAKQHDDFLLGSSFGESDAVLADQDNFLPRMLQVYSNRARSRGSAVLTHQAHTSLVV